MDQQPQAATGPHWPSPDGAPSAAPAPTWPPADVQGPQADVQGPTADVQEPPHAAPPQLAPPAWPPTTPIPPAYGHLPPPPPPTSTNTGKVVAITLAATLAFGGSVMSGLVWWFSHRSHSTAQAPAADGANRQEVSITLPDRFEDVPGVPDQDNSERMLKALGPMLADPIQVLYYDTTAGEVHVVAGRTKFSLRPKDIEEVAEGFERGSDKNGRHAQRYPAPRGATTMVCVAYTATRGSCLTISPTSAEMVITIGRPSTSQTATSMWEASATVR